MRENFRVRVSNLWGQGKDKQPGFHQKGVGRDFREELVSVFIGNLNPIIDSMGLWSIFKIFGKVRDVYLSSTKSANQSCFAFIRFETREEADKVAQKMNGIHVYGWPIVAKVATYDWNKRRTNARPVYGKVKLNEEQIRGGGKNGGYEKAYQDTRAYSQEGRSYAEAVKVETHRASGVRNVQGNSRRSCLGLFHWRVRNGCPNVL
ncbi:hypothetical protein Ddye_027627 [Dipteronia dyeriana]|uniref:RRM domain-containing protein n=1 Tax=Dipteronia dyeriana TaxID=168575 RepID=A0AAD9TPI4_9ROSI|nr:hypothetical protein Ddye_027627 [Dipteronia dyeriana]